MASVEMVMPKMGESIIEATILKWLKKPGEEVKKDESVLEVATDKVDTEVPSTVAGILAEILYKEGDVVAIGKAIARIETEGSQTPTYSPSFQEKRVSQPIAETKPILQQNKPVFDTASKPSVDRFYSPLVMNIAR